MVWQGRLALAQAAGWSQCVCSVFAVRSHPRGAFARERLVQYVLGSFVTQAWTGIGW